METNVNCPRCGTSLTIDEDILGRPFTCPSCQGTVTIPKKKLPPPPRTQAVISLSPEKEEPMPEMPQDIPPLYRSPWVPGPPGAPGVRVTVTDVKIPFLSVLYIAFQFALASLFMYVVLALLIYVFTGGQNILVGRYVPFF